MKNFSKIALLSGILTLGACTTKPHQRESDTVSNDVNKILVKNNTMEQFSYRDTLNRMEHEREVNEYEKEIDPLILNLIEKYKEQTNLSESSKSLRKNIVQMCEKLGNQAHEKLRRYVSQRGLDSKEIDDTLQFGELFSELYTNRKEENLKKENNTDEVQDYIKTMKLRKIFKINLSKIAKVKVNFTNHDFDIGGSKLFIDKENDNRYFLVIKLQYNGGNDLLKYGKLAKPHKKIIPFSFTSRGREVLFENGEIIKVGQNEEIKIDNMEFEIQFDRRHINDSRKKHRIMNKDNRRKR